MTARRRAAAIFEIARGPSYIWKAAVLAAFRVGERLLLAAALMAATTDLRTGVEMAAILGAIHLARAMIATRLRTETSVRVELLAASAVLEADPLHPLATDGEDSFATVIEGTDHAVRLAVGLLPDAAADAVATVVLLAVLAVRGTRTESLAFLGAMAAAAVVALVVRRDTARRARVAWNAHLPVWRQLRTILGGRYELVACGHGDDAERELATRLESWRAVEDHYRLVAAIAGGLPILAAWSAIGIAAVARLHGGIDSTFLGQAALLGGCIPPVVGLLWALHEMTKAERGFAPLGELFRSAHERRDEERALAHDDVQTMICIEARSVGFAYRDEARPALLPTSFTLKAGRVLAIAGPNGSGKTTLLRLLLRLAAPTEGSIVVDGVQLATLGAKAWRRSIAYVAQVPYVDEDATVRDFVQLLAPGTSDTEICAALDRVAVLSRLAAAGDPLAKRMRTLSAGQMQRIVLARALVQRAKIVLFDEPDGSLDADGVELLATLLRELAKDRMVAVVAHSPVLLAAADDVITLAARASSSAASSK